MKKLLTILLILALSLSMLCFASCDKDGGGSTPLTNAQKLEAAVDKTMALDELESNIDITISFEIELLGTKTTITVPIQSNIKVKNASSTTPEYYMIMDAEALGQQTHTETYSDGEWEYTLEDGTGTKSRVDAESEEDFKETFDEVMVDLPIDLVNNTEFESVENGLKITVQVPEETFAQAYKELVEGLTESYGEDATVSNAVVSAVIDSNGYISHYEISFDIEMPMDIGLGEPTTALGNAQIVIDFVNPGQNVTITPMTGYQYFPEE